MFKVVRFAYLCKHVEKGSSWMFESRVFLHLVAGYLMIFPH